MTAEQQAQVRAAVRTLSAGWSAAARAGDVDRALACFRDAPGFCFTYQGGMVNTMAGFRELTRSSYENRTSIETVHLSSQVTIIDARTAILAGRSRVTVVPKSEQRRPHTLEVIWGLIGVEKNGSWLAEHAYEFVVK